MLAEFADRLISVAPDRLSSNAKMGWNTICRILQQIEDQYTWVVTAVPPAGYEDEEEEMRTEFEDEDLNYLIFWRSNLPGCRKACDHIGDERRRAFGRNRLLGHIWAACQCEFLTYRRLREGESWTSNRLDVRILLKSLESSSEASIPFVAADLMESYCDCGVFGGFDQFYNVDYEVDDFNRICLLREDACKGYYSNLDIWDRTIFLDDTLFQAVV